jgi:hypothetical protein
MEHEELTRIIIGCAIGRVDRMNRMNRMNRMKG